MVRKINQRRLPDLRACLCEREQIGGGLIIWAGPISTVPPPSPHAPPAWPRRRPAFRRRSLNSNPGRPLP